MTALLAVLLFGTAFAASAWALYASIRPQLHRYRAVFTPVTLGALPVRPTRVTARGAQARYPVRVPLLAAA